jgi:hypothetical protein
MQLDIARNFAEIRNERHQEAASQVAGVGEQVTQSSSATGELLSLSAGQPGCKSARSFSGTDGAPACRSAATGHYSAARMLVRPDSPLEQRRFELSVPP